MTERASPSPGSRHAAISRLFVRAILSQCKSCLAASLPSQALTRQLSQRESLWRVGRVHAGRAKRDVLETVVLRCLDSRQLDKVRCPEAAALCSKARPFTSYRAFSGQAKVARPAKGSPFGGAGERSETERAGLQKKLFMNAISLAARAGIASSRRTGRTGWGRVRSISKPPL